MSSVDPEAYLKSRSLETLRMVSPGSDETVDRSRLFGGARRERKESLVSGFGNRSDCNGVRRIWFFQSSSARRNGFPNSRSRIENAKLQEELTKARLQTEMDAATRSEL